MPSFRTVRRVPFTPDQMFAVVADVERYPDFLPLCEGLTVHERREEEDGASLLEATMTVGYGAIRERFTTRVSLDPVGRQIRACHIDGPFSRLDSAWRFEPAAGGADVHFFIEYAFRSTMLALIAGAAFDKAVRHYTEAFEARAQMLYGTPAGV